MYSMRTVCCGLLVLLLSAPCSKCTNYGSITVPSREVFQSISGAPNNILGFAGMYNGFMLAGATTAVNFKSYLPVGTTMILNGGTVSLATDLFLDSNLIIGSSGNFTGNNHTIEFAPHDQTILLPYVGQMNQLNSKNAGASARVVNWSPDGQYVAVGTVSQTGSNPELRIYSFNGLSLTLTASAHFGQHIYDLAWNPVLNPPSYYLAVASYNALYAYKFTPPSTLVATSTLGTNTVWYAVAWHPLGNALATSRFDTTNQIMIFDFSTGTLTAKTTYAFPSNLSMNTRALAFDHTGSYLAAGFYSNSYLLQVLSWNGTSLVSTTSASPSYGVNTVAWSPDNSLIVIGLNGGSNTLQAYRFNRNLNSLTLLPSYLAGETVAVNSIDWSPDGRTLAVGNSGASNFGLQLFAVNPAAQRLLMANEYPLAATTYEARWSPNGAYVATSDSASNVTIFNFLPGAMTLSNANVVFNSPVQLRGPISFSGACIVDGNGYTLDLNSNSISVAAGASLLFRNIVLENISGTNLQCLDSAATISFDNAVCILNNNMTFTLGQLAVIGDCTMTGTGIFIYQTNLQSTIFPSATWYFDRGMTFSYYPTGGSNNRINFADSTAQLYLYETALFAKSAGLQLTKGTVSIDGQCPFYSEATTSTGGIVFGDNLSSGNDVNLKIMPESIVDVRSGYVVYQNVGS